MIDDGTGTSEAATANARARWQLRLRSLARDFLLIVTGVLTALGLENWNAALRDRDLEAEYLRALSAEVRAHVAQYDQWLELFARHQGWTETIWGWANGSAPDQPAEQVLLWMRLGGQIHPNTHFQDGAYQDLVSSGRLGLLRNRTLREAVVNYYSALPYWAGAIESNGVTAAEQYRTAVDGLIPPTLAWRSAMHEQLASVDLATVLEEFGRRPAVRQALVGMAQSHDFRIGITEDSRERSLSLLGQLEAELAR
jgi:hypothetical protein